MCNRYGCLHPYHELVEEFFQTRIPIRFPAPTATPNLPSIPEIRLTDPAPLIRAHEDGAHFDMVRWGFPPWVGAGPVVNFRSEGQWFANRRCLIPASYFFEFTGETYPKTCWRFSRANDGLFSIAGLWRSAEGWAFAMLITNPGSDVALYHDRQVVVLEREQWADWLIGEAPDSLLRSSRPAF